MAVPKIYQTVFIQFILLLFINKSGVLSVAKDAPLGDYVLAAKWLSDPEYIAELKINIYKRRNNYDSRRFYGVFN